MLDVELYATGDDANLEFKKYEYSTTAVKKNGKEVTYSSSLEFFKEQEIKDIAAEILHERVTNE